MQTQILFTPSPIVVPPLELPSREIGAVIEFHGLVREMENGRALEGLHYEAYLPMAERQLTRIFTNLNVHSRISAVNFIHRLGWVPTGQCSLYVRVLAAHRSEAFRFCQEAIDALKKDVPIWKKA
jgi:molybdopterin synthase catalytic subunit